jgi:hypothetical protein
MNDGKYYFKSRQFLSAFKSFNSAIQLCPLNSELYELMCFSCIELDDEFSKKGTPTYEFKKCFRKSKQKLDALKSFSEEDIRYLNLTLKKDKIQIWIDSLDRIELNNELHFVIKEIFIPYKISPIKYNACSKLYHSNCDFKELYKIENFLIELELCDLLYEITTASGEMLLSAYPFWMIIAFPNVVSWFYTLCDKEEMVNGLKKIPAHKLYTQANNEYVYSQLACKTIIQDYINRFKSISNQIDEFRIL